MESFVASHPEWNGKVKPVLINGGMAESGIPSCESKTTMPILQDDQKSAFFWIFGMPYNGLVVVDPEGTIVFLVAQITFPDIEPKAEAAIIEALQ